MTTIDPVVVGKHAQHVHLYATQLHNAAQHADHDGQWTAIALGGLGQIIFEPMDTKMGALGSAMDALGEKGDDVRKRIDATAKIHHFTEQANKQIMDDTKTHIDDPDLYHAPRSINDFPDLGLSGDIAQFASNCPQYAKAGAMAVVMGAVGLALDVLGYALDPVGNIFGELAGVIIDCIVPLKKVLDFLLGDPGALQDSSTAYDEIALYLSETAHTFDASLSEITPKTWDEPGSSDVYLKAANNLIQLAIVAGEGAEEISGEILLIGSLLGDVRSHVFDHIVGFVVEAILTATLGAEAAGETLGTSLIAAAGLIEEEADLTMASIVVELIAAISRLGAASMVANQQAENYRKLTADIKK